MIKVFGRHKLAKTWEVYIAKIWLPIFVLVSKVWSLAPRNPQCRRQFAQGHGFRLRYMCRSCKFLQPFQIMTIEWQDYALH